MAKELFPIILTQRLRLTPFTADHLTDRYVQWLNDPTVTRYSEQRHRHHSLSSCRDFLHTFSGTPHHFWAIECRDGNLGHIGNIVAIVDAPNRGADLSIMIGEKRAWRKGFGEEAWQAACSSLIKHEHLRKISAGTMADNAPMLGIMRAVGMTQEGRRIRHLLLQGREVDLVQMALFSS